MTYKTWREIELEKQQAALVAALEAVEWAWAQGSIVQECPWCGHSKAFGHADDCKRQQALAAVATKESTS